MTIAQSHLVKYWYRTEMLFYYSVEEIKRLIKSGPCLFFLWGAIYMMSFLTFDLKGKGRT